MTDRANSSAGAALTTRKLKPGDVLLFDCPERGYAQSNRPSRKPRWEVEANLCFHELISAIDCVHWTHAVLVLSQHDGVVHIANSDEDGVRDAVLDEIRWEYGHAPISVYRPVEDAFDAPEETVRAAAVREGERLTKLGLKYPDNDMLVVGELLAIRDAAPGLPFVNDKATTRWRRSRRIAADLIALRRTIGRREAKEGWMCAALVAQCFAAAGYPLLPAETTPNAGPVTVTPECQKQLVDVLHGLTKRPRTELETALDRIARRDTTGGFGALEIFRYFSLALWGYVHMVRPPKWTRQVVKASGVWTSRFVTAYDLANSQSLQYVGECAW
jgi:hypothetical protein